MDRWRGDMPTPRKHDLLHELQNTKPHDRSIEMTPSTLVAGRPSIPKSLKPGSEEKRIYKLLCRQLLERRALTEADRYLLELAATIWARRSRAKEKLLAEGEVAI